MLAAVEAGATKQAQSNAIQLAEEGMRMSISEAVTKAALFVLWLLAVCTPPYLIWRWMRSRRPSTTPRPMTVEGANRIVPVLATFTGLRGLAWFGAATNNLNPKLVIEPDGITFKVLRLQTRCYDQIEQVDLRIFGATVNLCFTFRGEALTLDANLGNLALAAEVLRMLSGRVALSDRARNHVGSRTRGTPSDGQEVVVGRDGAASAASGAERRFRFQPRWKEELVVVAREGTLVLVLAMGIPTAYLPTPAEWALEAPEWARSLWPTLREELEEWCRENGTQLIIGGPAGLSAAP